jgi:hypothetical protein
MTAGSETTAIEPSGSFPFDAVLSRCLVWQDADSHRRYALLTEPTNDSLTAQRAAEAVVIRVWESLRELRYHDPVDAAMKALMNAHQTVRRANLLPGGQRRAELGLVGASLCIIERDQMVVAIAAPAQVFLLQDNELTPWPRLEERRHEFAFSETPVESAPLGGADCKPAVAVTQVIPGDRVLLCSNDVGEQLARLHDEYPTRLLDRLAKLMRENAATAEPRLRELLGSSKANLLAVFAPADPLTADAEPPHVVVRNQSLEATARQRNTMETGADALMTETSPGTLPADRVVNPVLAMDKPGGVAPISSRVFTRYEREGSPLRESLRVWMPRGPWEAIPLWSVGLVLLMLLAFGGGAKLYQRQQDRQDQAARYLAEVDLQLSTLGVGGDGDVLRDQVTAAEAALNNAREYGASEHEIDQREGALVAARDRINNVNRLQNVQALGQLPAAAETSAHPKLVRVGNAVFLISNAVYRINADDGQLVYLLGEGDRVGKMTVGAIADGATDGTSLIVTDGVALYTLQIDDSWKGVALGLRESNEPWQATGVGAFDGAWYLLNGDAGSILRFDPEHLDTVPGDWTEGQYREDLAGAVDFVVDGYIYVITDQNKFVALYKGDKLVPQDSQLPAVNNPIAIYGGVGTSFLWVLENVDGTPTLVRITRDSYATVTYQVPFDWNSGAGFDDLAQIKDLVVLEDQGIVIFVTNDAVWQASVPYIG